MIVRSSVGRISSARASRAPGFPEPCAFPRSRSADRVVAPSFPSATPVIITTLERCGRRDRTPATLLYCDSSSTNTARARE